MNLDGSRFEVGQLCPGAPRCTAMVVWARVGGIRHLFEATPDGDGTHVLRDVGVDDPIALRPSGGGLFGRQGTLHRKHACKWQPRR